MIEQERFRLCIAICDEILWIDPHYPVALALNHMAMRGMHIKLGGGGWAEAVEPWKRVTDDGEDAVIPDFQVFRFPAREEWAEKRLQVFSPEDLDEWEAEQAGIRAKLERMPISLEFINALPEVVLAYMRDYSGLNIILDAAVRDRIEPDIPISIICRGVPLGHALNLVLAYSGKGLVPLVTREHVVLLTDPRNLSNY